MTQEEYIKWFLKPQILVPSDRYDLKSDKRLLIPFTSGDQVGFYNASGEVVVQPKYTKCYGDCYSKDDYIFVSRPFILPKSEGISKDHTYLNYGLIDYTGDEILPVRYRKLLPAVGNRNLYTLQNRELEYGVFTLQAEVIVPFGKYEWIDGFCNGLARVKINTAPDGVLLTAAKWGLIQENGKLVAICDYIFPFYEQSPSPINIKCKGQQYIVIRDTFGEGLYGCKKILYKAKTSKYYYQHCFLNLKCNEVITLGLEWHIMSGFKDGYAKIKSGVREAKVDKEGNITIVHICPMQISDDTDSYDLINDGLDGNPDAYWNID